jgi:hypothetical protein
MVAKVSTSEQWKPKAYLFSVLIPAQAGYLCGLVEWIA